MNYLFVPEVCKGESSLFEGSLVIRLPSAEERFSYLSETGIDFKEVSTANNFKSIAVMMKKSYDHILKIDLKKRSTGEAVTEIDQLRYDPDCFAIVTELANKMFSGFVLGKS